ncbi:hypothetical protein ACHAXT_012513 [Thalassiosira profunda]
MDTFGNDLGMGGQVLTREELIKKRQRNGQCPTCGQKCFKKKLFKLEPITITGQVLDGRCLSCNPQDPKSEDLVASCAVAAPPKQKSMRIKRKPRGTPAASTANLSAGARSERNVHSARSAPSARGLRAEDSDEEEYQKKASSRSAPAENHSRLHDTSHRSGGSGSRGGRADRSHRSGGSRSRRELADPPRGGMERRTSSHRDDFLQRQNPRPSTVFLGGIDVDQLFQEGDESDLSQDSPNGHIPPAARRLSVEERKALRQLNGERNTFAEIVNIMMVNSTSPSVQNEGLHALSLVHDPDAGELEDCAESCGFEVIVSAMGQCSQDAMAQTNACKVLFIASAAGESLQTAIGSAGGIEALVDAMKQFEDDVIVLEGCLLALSNLCIPEGNLPYALGGQLIELAVNAMSQNVENSGLQEHGCAVLANLAVHDPARRRIRDCGGCDTVVVSMVVNPLDAGVQCQALVALRNLCVKDDENKVLLANAGAIDVVVQAMQNHRDDAQVQARGSWALGIIGMNEDNKLYIGENGGVDVIVRSMWVHPDDVEVQEKACRTLWTLSVPPRNRLCLVEVDAISAIVTAMQGHAPDANIQEKGCGVLCNLAANDDDTKVRIVNEGALEVVVMAMVLHGENEMIAERAVALLHKLCIPENIEKMVNANVSPMMAVVTETFPDCQEKATFVLAQLNT